jgi:DNA adenine methylase
MATIAGNDVADRLAENGELRSPAVLRGSTSGASVRYPGGKNGGGMWQWIVSKMPPHAYYAEPFAGSGAVLRRKPPALMSFIVESDDEVLAWWRKLKWPGTIVARGDGIRWLEKMDSRIEGDAEDWLVYCDPPYLPETRTKKRIYRRELTADEHVTLLRRLNRLDCHCMVSGYPSKLYERYLGRWHRDERQAMTRGGLRTEVLWCNFDPARESSLGLTMPAAGSNFRERERIKRKRKRWHDRFAKMPSAERHVVLSALLEAERIAGTSPSNVASPPAGPQHRRRR